jgi:hypothetical protein
MADAIGGQSKKSDKCGCGEIGCLVVSVVGVGCSLAYGALIGGVFWAAVAVLLVVRMVRSGLDLPALEDKHIGLAVWLILLAATYILGLVHRGDWLLACAGVLVLGGVCVFTAFNPIRLDNPPMRPVPPEKQSERSVAIEHFEKRAEDVRKGR